MKILLVDDSKSVHALLEEMLDGCPVTLQHVYNGKQAVEAIQVEGFQADLVILDWEMPQMTGIEALPEIRRIRKDLFVLMMTSLNTMSHISEALEKGANDYLIKPFTRDILIGKIEQVTGSEVENRGGSAA